MLHCTVRNTNFSYEVKQKAMFLTLYETVTMRQQEQIECHSINGWKKSSQHYEKWRVAKSMNLEVCKQSQRSQTFTPFHSLSSFTSFSLVLETTQLSFYWFKQNYLMFVVSYFNDECFSIIQFCDLLIYLNAQEGAVSLDGSNEIYWISFSLDNQSKQEHFK